MATILDQELDNWSDKFKEKQIHLVCVAAKGLTTCDCAATAVGGIDGMTVAAAITKVNQLGETGTLWPRLPMTIIPLLQCEERKSPDEDDIDEFLRRSFQDVAKANREYIKSRVLYIDLNGWGSGYDYRRARRIAGEVLANEQTIDAVYFAPRAKEPM